MESRKQSLQRVKTCSNCKESLSIDSFHKCVRSRDGFLGRCKSCVKIDHSVWYEKNKHAVYERHIKYTFKLDLNEYEILKINQNNRCALCNQVESRDRKLCIDHDHITGRIRGLLCTKCNKALGWIENNNLSAEKIFQYLKESD